MRQVALQQLIHDVENWPQGPHWCIPWLLQFLPTGKTADSSPAPVWNTRFLAGAEGAVLPSLVLLLAWARAPPPVDAILLLLWQTSSHDLWLILSWHLTNWSAHQEPAQRFTWFWKVRASYTNNDNYIPITQPTEASGYLPDDFNVKICVEQYSTC